MCRSNASKVELGALKCQKHCTMATGNLTWIQPLFIFLFMPDARSHYICVNWAVHREALWVMVKIKKNALCGCKMITCKFFSETKDPLSSVLWGWFSRVSHFTDNIWKSRLAAASEMRQYVERVTWPQAWLGVVWHFKGQWCRWHVQTASTVQPGVGFWVGKYYLGLCRAAINNCFHLPVNYCSQWID